MQEARQFRSFLLRTLVFLSVFFALTVAELFILPIDYFTFRPWEALVSKNYLPSTWRFYPDKHLVKNSIGYFDNFNRTKDPVTKYEEWFTDQNGFRNRPRPMPQGGYDLWVWGNSNIVGAFNTQSDILTEQVERKCGATSYSLGSGSISPIHFADPEFVKNPPRHFAALLDIGPPPHVMARYIEASTQRFGVKEGGHAIWTTPFLILWDRFNKQAGREWLRSRLGINEIQRTVNDARAIRAGGSEDVPAARESFARIEQDVRIFSDRLRSIGSELILIFQPTPNQIKNYMPLIDRLRAQGHKIIAWEPTPLLADGVPPDFWHVTDSHWTEKAIGDAAARLCRVMAPNVPIRPES